MKRYWGDIMNEYYEMFKNNFPYIVREDNTALEIINDSSNKIIERRNDDNTLIGLSIINKNSIYMLCVDKKYRNQGIGSKLLEESEKYILDSGYDTASVGVGDTYLMPGVPMATKAYEEELQKDKIYENIDNSAYNFFKKRGYYHSWDDANCFDMRSDFNSVDFPKESVGDTIDGILYRWATISDLDKIVKCSDDAHIKFTKYYKDESLYEENSKRRVLVAIDKDIICGALIVATDEAEKKGFGSVGCTIVMHAYRGRHIGVNLVVLGNKALKEQGIKEGYLGYTYSGLDKMYGYAGYKICIYYFMANKKL